LVAAPGMRLFVWCCLFQAPHLSAPPSTHQSARTGRKHMRELVWGIGSSTCCFADVYQLLWACLLLHHNSQHVKTAAVSSSTPECPCGAGPLQGLVCLPLAVCQQLAACMHEPSQRSAPTASTSSTHGQVIICHAALQVAHVRSTVWFQLHAKFQELKYSRSCISCCRWLCFAA
jgi:hypothetical protein